MAKPRRRTDHLKALDLTSQDYLPRWRALLTKLEPLMPWVHAWDVSCAGGFCSGVGRSPRKPPAEGLPLLEVEWRDPPAPRVYAISLAASAAGPWQSIRIAPSGEVLPGLHADRPEWQPLLERLAQVCLAHDLTEAAEDIPAPAAADLTPAEKLKAAQLKAAQLQALQMVLPESAEVADMLRAWRAADARYWAGQLKPCWLTAAIEPYGHCLGSWSPHTRTLNLVPMLWNGAEAEQWVDGVVIHECCHQAQSQLYRHLDREAKGPRGRWTDTSHRCPSWSRAVEDVIQADGLDVFCPVWRRSTGNLWRPWVPASEDWLTWEQADPEATIDGRKLLGFDAAMHFPPFLFLGLTAEWDL